MGVEFFLGPSSGVARALKTSWTDPDKGWRGKHRQGQGGELAVRKKSIGVPASSFRLSRAVDFRAEKKRETIIGTGSVKVEGWWGLQLDGERKFCKGGADGGGGRAKGKTTAERHILGRLRKHGRAGEC